MTTNLIKTDALKTLFEDQNCLVFDCRFDLSDVTKGQRAYAESHIPGAIYAHLDDHLSSPITADSGRHPMPEMGKFVQWLATCGLTKSSQVVIYDDSFGVMASRLWWLLSCLGHESVAILDGGWQAWGDQGYVVDNKMPVLKATDFYTEFNDECVVSTQQVVKNLTSVEFQLVDVRSNERFIGKLEPIDPIAGHIPMAINIPLTENLDEIGFFKSIPQLKQQYSALCGQWPVDQQVYMCGSGVTACHSVFALVVAGLGKPRVYAGSWSEWIRDSSRPIATGKE